MNDNKDLIVHEEESNNDVIVLDKRGLIDFIKEKVRDNLEVSINISKNKDSGDIGISFNLSFKDDKFNK